MASDNCSSLTVSNNAPGTFPFGLTLVRWTVTDESGNQTVCTQRHSITLIVGDGTSHAMDTVAFEVITAGQAVGELIVLADEASLARKNKRPLIATLKAAMTAFEEGRTNPRRSIS